MRSISSHPWMGSAVIGVLLLGSHQSVSLATEPAHDVDTGEIVVHVLDEAGSPQAGAEVSLFVFNAESRLWKNADREARTDSSGMARYDRLHTEFSLYLVWAKTADKRIGFRDSLFREGTARLTPDLIVQRPTAATIHIRDEGGKPIAGASIWMITYWGTNGVARCLVPEDLKTFGLAPKSSDVDGNLSLPELPPGKAFVQLVDPNHAPYDVEEIKIANGSTTDVTMLPGVKLTLHVKTPAKAPMLDGLQIRLIHVPALHPSTLVGQLPHLRPDGTIQLTVAAGKYSMLEVSHPEYAITPEYHELDGRTALDQCEPFELRPLHDDFTFQLMPKDALVRGRLLDEATGKPMPGQTVSSEVRADIPNGPLARFATEWIYADSSKSDDRGEFEVRSAAGDGRINAYAPGMIALPEHAEFNVAADGAAVVSDILMRPIPRIHGVVRDQDGKPVARAIVRFRDSDLDWDRPVVTDVQGRFELSPSGMPTDLLTGKPKPLQTILAFHPYEPLGAQIQVRFSDAKSLDNVALQLTHEDYGFPVTGFPDELSAVLRGVTPEVRAQREANSRGGKPAPELDGAVWLNTDKPKMSLAAFRGKYVLLQFWTTWCGPCHIDMPNVKLAHDLYKDKGMIVIGVHDNSTPIDGIKQDVAQQGLSYPIAVDGADGRILESYKALGVSGYPTYILIGPDGTIVEDPTGTARGLRMYMLEILRQKLMSPSSGIGAAVRIERGKVLVSSILPGSAAARTHSLQPNDRIIAVAEVSAEPVDVTGLDLVKVVGLIRGRNGTIVRLTMVPAGKDESDARVISLTRGEVKTSLGSLDNGKLLSPGAVAPNFRFTRMDGTEGDLSRLRGKVVVLEMWASWCKPCVQLVGKLQTLREEHPEWSGQVEILAVSVDEERGNAADCSEANQWNKIPPVWSGTSLCSAYHINGLPTTYIIDHDGRVVAADWSLDIPQTLRDKHLLVVENK